MAIQYPSDFLESSLRPGELYELVISLGLEITETAFRSAISELNVKFISPRLVFSGSLQGKEIKVFYSTSGDGISQRDVVFALMSGFESYAPSILFEKSEGEIPGAVPLIPEVTGPRGLFSPEWIPEFFAYMKEEVKEVAKDVADEIEKLTGWPRWAIPYILGGGAITIALLVLYIKTKPLLVFKAKGS